MNVTYPRALVNDQLPNDLTVLATESVPWRTATIRGAALSGMVTASMGPEEAELLPVFLGLVDDDGSTVRDVGAAVARGLPDWRREIGPQSFQDVRLETLLAWAGTACGGVLDCKAEGGLVRHYALRRGPAYQVVREALASWRNVSTLLELDGGVLYIGGETGSPHAQAGVMFKAVRSENILALTRLGNGVMDVTLPLTPALRVGNRGTLDHPLYSGPARVVEVEHCFGSSNSTRIQVAT